MQFQQLLQNQEIAQKIAIYKTQLLEFNQNYNLIGKSTIEDFDNRHIIDCAQIYDHIPDLNANIADLGSGAGLPGIILAILGVKNITLFEKSYRKSQFLSQICQKIDLKNVNLQQNINDYHDQKFDLIISRAFGNLNKILDLSPNLLQKNGQLLLLKGQKLPEEIKQAQKNWQFNYKTSPSQTSQDGQIILLTPLFIHSAT